ncbi:hypothetical protein PVAG01_08226 [Phlyctema vagabunda]|uniref:DUF7371 domain-containing protein n=1 Tax=Phlyctema vagabunda TaxID=108571 RepID=A0ABR4P8T5_9HELO
MRIKLVFTLGAATALVAAAPASSGLGDACGPVTTVFVPTVTTVYATDLEVTRTLTSRSTKVAITHTITAVVTVTSSLATQSTSSLESISGFASDISATTSSLEPVSTNSEDAFTSSPVTVTGASATTSSFEPVSTNSEDAFTSSPVTATGTSAAPGSSDNGDGIFSFFVSGTSTIWVNGQTPDAAKSVVYLTASVTITPTITHTTTVRPTSRSTIWTTETVQQSSPSMAVSFTGGASVGWNQSNTLSIPGSNGPTSGSTSLGFSTFANSTIMASATVPVNVSLVVPTTASTLLPVTFQNQTIGISTALVSASVVNSTTVVSTAIPVNTSLATLTATSAALPVSVENSTSVLSTSTVSSVRSITFVTSGSAVFPAFPVNTSSADPAVSKVSSVLVTAPVFSTGISTTLSTGALVNSTTTATISALPVTSSSIDPAITSSVASASFNTTTSVFSTQLNNSTVTGTSAAITASTSVSSVSTAVTSLTSIDVSSSAASASPTACGEIGDFVLNFDDIPPLVVSNNTDPHDVQPAPVFNPYHQFDFSEGFTVVPPPTALFVPESGKLLLEFIPSLNGTGFRGLGSSGGISDGDHGLTGCFDFNFYGASLGCDSRGSDCDFTFSGYRLANENLVEVASHHDVIPACKTASQCELSPIQVDNTFQNLDSIRINVTVAGVPKVWWMDDLKLGWFNNTCEMGLCRQNTRLH